MPSRPLPSELTPGRLLSWQASLEDQLQRAIDRRSVEALTAIKAEALARQLLPAFARQAWEDAVSKAMADVGLSPSLDDPITQELREDLLAADLGEEAYASAMRVMALQPLSRTNTADLSRALDEALSLETPTVERALTAAGAWTSKVLAKASRLGSVWRTRLKRQVRTGFTGVTGRMVLAELRTRGATHKRWVTRHDGKVRPSHAAADGQVQGLDMPFTVGGESLQHPGERGKSLDETANCRCVIVPADRPSTR